MGRYSIKDLEELSGIKAHTIRIWEQRYKILCPKRTETNIRYYTDEDIRRLLNISLLNRNGFKISKISDMDETDIRKAVLKISETNFEYHTQINTLTISMIDLDESRFEKVMSTCILRFGLENTMIEVVYPFLKKIGIMWQTGSITPCHEHFISNLIRQKVIVAIDAQINPDNEKTKKFLLFLPEQELHEIGLLFASYLIKARNNKVIYLGSSVPFDDLREVYHIHKPEYLLTLITSTTKGDIINTYLKKLADEFPKATIMVSFHEFIGKLDKLPGNVKLLKTLNDLIKYLENDERVKDNHNYINMPRK